MKKYILLLLTIILMLPFSLNALEINGLYSKNIMVYNVDEGKVLYEKSADKSTPIASLTKIMTTLVALENIEDLDEKIKITWGMLNEVPWDASIAGFQAGDSVTYRDLLYGVMLPSGADAASALAISVAGSEEDYVKLMNDKAKELNLNDTTFIDTTGYYQNKSTAKDITNLLLYALKNEEFKKIFETKEYTTTNNLKFKATILSYSKKLPYDLSYVLGSKTGYTDEAGLCLATISNIKDEKIITVSLNAIVDSDMNKHIKDLNTIYETVDSNFSKIKLFNQNDNLYKIKTKYTKNDYYVAKTTDDIYKYVEGEFDESLVKVEYDGQETIWYNTPKGTLLGTLKVYYDKDLVETIQVKLEEELSFNLISFVKDNYILLTVGFIVLLVIYIRIKRKMRRRKKKR